MKNLSLVAALVASLSAVSAQAQTVYSNNFDSPAVTNLGATATFNSAGGGLDSSIGIYAATYGLLFRNESTGLTTLTLNNLPIHTGASLGFVLAFLDSWDSYDGGCCSPDSLTLSVDGIPKGVYTYNNALGTVKDIDGGTLLHEYVQFDSASGSYSDTVVNMSGDPNLTFAHSASTLTISWQAGGGGWQGGTDEAWGMDNLNVALSGVVFNPVPEPETYAMLIAGLGLLGFAARRRKQQVA